MTRAFVRPARFGLTRWLSVLALFTWILSPQAEQAEPYGNEILSLIGNPHAICRAADDGARQSPLAPPVAPLRWHHCVCCPALGHLSAILPAPVVLPHHRSASIATASPTEGHRPPPPFARFDALARAPPALA